MDSRVVNARGYKNFYKLCKYNPRVPLWYDIGHLKYVVFFFKNEDISSADTFDVLRE